MRDPGLLLVDMLTWLAQQKAAPLRIVECGTIRHPSFEGHEDGLATYHLARWIAKQRHTPHEFYSFELTAGHLKACQAFLRDDGLDDYVTFGLGDADLLLEHFCQPIDLCYLDAGASPVENLSQYRRAEKWLRPPGMMVIDDVFDPRNADRGLVTVPYARLEGHKVACIAGRLALISFGVDDYPLPADSYWLQPGDPMLLKFRDDTRYCANCHCAEHSDVHTGRFKDAPNQFLRNMVCDNFVPKPEVRE